ncbi:MAG: serine/threonine protein kinase [Deltaproteobacteria bacterium]|nr:serine/threonine protein kinase [Deltaproteobacteria bacterium]
MAEIFLARQKSVAGFERNLVLKRILPELASHPEFVEAFVNEARLAAQLNHPNIVQIIDLGRDGDTYFLAMEYIQGASLLDLMQLAKKSTPPPLGVSLSTIFDAAAGLHHAHFARDLDGAPLNVVHRDVTPSNIIVSYDGIAKVVDFGIAKATVQQGKKTQTGALKGKLGYFAPEQVLGESIDKRVDVFALGICAYELLANAHPFRQGTEYDTLRCIAEGRFLPLSAHAVSVPAPIEEVIARALARKPDDRYQTCGELLGALQAAALAAEIMPSHAQVARYIGERRTALDASEAQRAQAVGTRGDNTATSTSPPSGASLSFPLEVLSVRPSVSASGVVTATAPRVRLRMASLGVVATLIVVAVAAATFQVKEPIQAPVSKGTEAASLPGQPTAATLPAHTLEPLSPFEQKPARVADAKTGKAQGQGRLRVLVSPWGDVFVDGRAWGQTPFKAREIVAGEHVVRVENPDAKKPLSKRVVVREGREVVVEFTF